MKSKINVVSLFDGSGIAYLALKRLLNELGIGFNYYASEIDERAIEVAQYNNPEIIQVGDIRNLTRNQLPKDIHFVISGSPCQDFSYANRFGDSGFYGQKSSLIWEAIRVLEEVKPNYFLFENVCMRSRWRDIISERLGVEPIEINSRLVSAQNRPRLYWTNKSNIVQPEDLGLVIRDIIYDDDYKIFYDERIFKTIRRTSSGFKWDLSGKGYFSQQDRAYCKDSKICTISTSPSAIKIVKDLDNMIFRKIHPIEAERCQTWPDNYTNVNNLPFMHRFKMIGNGYTLDVISHILKSVFK